MVPTFSEPPLFFGSLTAKAMAPFADKRVDTNELTTHATLALAQSVPDGKHGDELTRLTTQMVQSRELKELKGDFSKLYTDIANRLEHYHGIRVEANDNKKTQKTVNEQEKTEQIESKSTQSVEAETTIEKSELSGEQAPTAEIETTKPTEASTVQQEEVTAEKAPTDEVITPPTKSTESPTPPKKRNIASTIANQTLDNSAANRETTKKTNRPTEIIQSA